MYSSTTQTTPPTHTTHYPRRRQDDHKGALMVKKEPDQWRRICMLIEMLRVAVCLLLCCVWGPAVEGKLEMTITTRSIRSSKGCLMVVNGGVELTAE